MKLLKFIKINVIIFILLWASRATCHIPYSKCDFKYTVQSWFTLCSEQPVDLEKIQIISSRYYTAMQALQEFMPIRGTDKNIKLTIYSVNFELLNNIKIFSKGVGQVLYGKYIDEDGALYTYPRALVDATNTDFIHELVHFYIDRYNINLNYEANEDAAQRFELYYAHKFL